MDAAGIILVLFGLGAGTYGAYVLYRADYPRNDWILAALYSAADRPTYGVIAPAGWSPAAEKETAFAEATKFSQASQLFAEQSRKGMKLILAGFVLQAVGNAFLLWALIR